MAKTLTGQAFSAFGVVCVGFYISEEKMKNTEKKRKSVLRMTPFPEERYGKKIRSLFLKEIALTKSIA